MLTDFISNWIPAIAIVLTGVFGVFKMGSFVQKIVPGMESIERQFAEFVEDFRVFRHEDKAAHEAADRRLTEIEKRLP